MPGREGPAKYPGGNVLMPELTSDPHGPERTRWTLSEGGDSVSRLDVVDLHIHVGGDETLSVAGIGDVYTPEEFRGKGYATTMLRGVVERLQRGSAGAVMLSGIEHFYNRLGFAPCGAHFALTVALTDGSGKLMPGIPSAVDARLATPDDLATIEALYERASAHLVGSAVRPRDGRTWSRLQASLNPGGVIGPWPDKRHALPPWRGSDCLLVFRGGEAVAYAWRSVGHGAIDYLQVEHSGDFVIGDAAAIDEDAGDLLLRATTDWALEHGGRDMLFGTPGYRNVRMSVPDAHPAAIAARHWRGTHARHTNPVGGRLIRVLDGARLPEPLRSIAQSQPDGTAETAAVARWLADNECWLSLADEF